MQRLLCALLCASAAADGHGIYCTTQFNWWFTHDPNAEFMLLSLAAPHDPALTVCAMQSNANLLYYEYLARGGKGFPNSGGFDATCTAPGLGLGSFGLPAGGCAFSYPQISNSTCRLKIFGPHVDNELQWCQPNVTGTMRIARGTTGAVNPDHDFSCGEHTDFEVIGTTHTNEPWMDKGILIDVFANTVVNICPVAEITTPQSGKSSTDVVLIAITLAVALVSLVLLCILVARGRYLPESPKLEYKENIELRAAHGM